MGCRPIVLGPKQVRILRAPSSALAAEHRRARARDGLGRFAGALEAMAPNLVGADPR